MKTLLASVFALAMLGATAASADVGVGVHVGGVGVHAGVGGDHYDRGRRHHHRRCVRWGWRNHHQVRYCRQWSW